MNSYFLLVDGKRHEFICPDWLKKNSDEFIKFDRLKQESLDSIIVWIKMLKIGNLG